MTAGPSARSARFVAVLQPLVPIGQRSALAKKLGLKEARVRAFLNVKSYPPRPSNIEKLAAALGVDAETKRMLHLAAARDHGFKI